jgi:hypothetical protein
VKAVRDLDRVGGALPGAVRVGSRSIPGDHADAGMGLQPEGHGFGLTIGQEGERSLPFQIDEHRPIRPTFPNGPIVDAEHVGGSHLWEGLATE